MLKETLAQVFADEAVLLSLASEKYFSLDEVGTRVWETVTAASSVGHALEDLQETFDVDAEELRVDVIAFVGDLVEAGLIELVGP